MLSSFVLLNADRSSVVTLSGITTDVKFVLVNAFSPISVTVSGIVMVVNPGH